jgi:hypothetical protein
MDLLFSDNHGVDVVEKHTIADPTIGVNISFAPSVGLLALSQLGSSDSVFRSGQRASYNVPPE